MTGLVGWWPLNEDSGSTAYDLSGNENHGTLNGGVTRGVAGKGGLTSYSFDGNDDYLSVDVSSLDIDNSFTFTIWVNVGENSDGQNLFSFKDSSSNPNLNLKAQNTNNSGTPSFYVRDSSGTDLEVYADDAIINDGWHLISGTIDEEHMKIYIDGVEKEVKETSTLNGNFSIDTSGVIGGGYDGTFNHTTGSLSNARIYNRALTPEEIQELYKWGNGDYAKPLNDQNSSLAVSRWAFDGDTTDSWSGNSGSLNGSLDSSSFVDDSVRGQALDFDRSNNDYVDIPDGALVGGSDPRTVSAWIKPATLTNNYTFVGWGELSTSRSWNIQLNSTNDGEIFVMCWDNNFKTGTKVVEKESWNHIIVTYDGTGDEDAIKAYVNGSREELIVHAGDWTQLNTTESNGAIGRRSANNDLYFDGLIDDVRIYDKALSPSEVFELYRWGTRGRDMRKLTINSR